jgi:Arc/MetJ-type ribon-helix-helix transcriptional regulator
VGRFETLSEACRAGLRRRDEDARIVDRLVALGAEGMASGVDDGFDIDAFVEEARAGRTG